MQRMLAVVAIAAVALVGMVAAPRSDATELRASFSVAEDGSVVADGPAVGPDPADCLGPLSPISLILTINNNSQNPLNLAEMVVLTGPIQFPPGSTCNASAGTCTIVDPVTLKWTATIPPFTVGFATAVARVDAQAPAG